MMLGMLLDQQVTMEWAFGAPLLLKQRLGAEHLDASAIAAMDPAALEAVFRDKPALHRYPASMAKRTHDLCRHLVEHYDGRAEQVWAGVSTARRAARAGAGAPGVRQGQVAHLRRAARQTPRGPPAGLGGGRGRLAVDRRRRHLRTGGRDPGEEAGREGGQEGRGVARGPNLRYVETRSASLSVRVAVVPFAPCAVSR